MSFSTRSLLISVFSLHEVNMAGKPHNKWPAIPSPYVAPSAWTSTAQQKSMVLSASTPSVPDAHSELSFSSWPHHGRRRSWEWDICRSLSDPAQRRALCQSKQMLFTHVDRNHTCWKQSTSAHGHGWLFIQVARRDQSQTFVCKSFWGWARLRHGGELLTSVCNKSPFSNDKTTSEEGWGGV